MCTACTQIVWVHGAENTPQKTQRGFVQCRPLGCRCCRWLLVADVIWREKKEKKTEKTPEDSRKEKEEDGGGGRAEEEDVGKEEVVGEGGQEEDEDSCNSKYLRE